MREEVAKGERRGVAQGVTKILSFQNIQIFSDTNIHLYTNIFKYLFVFFSLIQIYSYICSYDFLVQIYSDIRSYRFLIQIYIQEKNFNLGSKSPKVKWLKLFIHRSIYEEKITPPLLCQLC